MLTSEAGRILAHQRKKKDKVCAVCKTPFKAEHWGKYCSPKCKYVARRKREAEKKNQIESENSPEITS
jgi:hypothetical protein